MDLIGSITQQLGIPEDMAKAAAGATLGLFQKTVADAGEPEAAGQMGDAIPELAEWKAKAAAEATPKEDTRDIGDILGGLMSGSAGGGSAAGAAGLLGALGGGGGGLLGGLAEQLGGPQARQMAALAGVFGNLGLEPSQAAMVAPMALNFLKDRLDPGLLDTLIKASPLVLSFMGKGGAKAPETGDGPDLGGLGGMLGKLF